MVLNIISTILFLLSCFLVSTFFYMQEPFTLNITMEDAALLINSIASLLEPIAWPLAVFLICLNFKKTISLTIQQLASRITRAGKDGVVFSHELQTADEEDNIRDESTLRDALKDQQIISHYIKIIKPELDKLANEANLPLDKFYLAKTTEFYIKWHLEKIYRNIFGSQIKVLQHLNSHGLNSTKSEIYRFYYEARTNNPVVYYEYSYEDWLLFLQSQSLILIDEDNVSISLEGQSFLSYIFMEQYDPNKSY